MTHSKSGEATRIDRTQLQTFVEEILKSGNVADGHAERLADCLVRADMRGVSSHGVSRLEVYMQKFTAGGFNPDPDLDITRLGDAVGIVDADHGPGQSAAFEAMDLAMELAVSSGVGFVSVANSNHCGTCAYYTEHASSNDFIGFTTTNVGPDVIPYGGVSPLLGTNPFSVSVPTDRSFPITLDMATSNVAMGKIQEEARKEDVEIPSDWAVDEEGQPTTDPHEAVAVRPLGGAKGYGLAIIVDVLSGFLSGSGPSYSIGPLYDDYGEPMRLGHFVGAIDISAFREIDAFKRDIDDYIERLKHSDTREGFDEIKLPGEMETKRRLEQERDGVELDPSTVESLQSLADEYDVEGPAGIE